jgi:hypothetical protein
MTESKSVEEVEQPEPEDYGLWIAPGQPSVNLMMDMGVPVHQHRTVAGWDIYRGDNDHGYVRYDGRVYMGLLGDVGAFERALRSQ